MGTADDFNLKGKVAILTGGAGLLGRQFVKTLLSAQAKVILVDLDFSNLDDDLKKNNSVYLIQTDITIPDQVRNMIKKSLFKYEKIDILINSAALDPKFDRDKVYANDSSFEKFSLDEWKKSLDVNLTGAFLCCQEVGKIMSNQRNGNIINIASTYGIVGPDQRIYKDKSNGKNQNLFKPVSYSVTKGGLIQLTRYLAAYWGDKNIRVNTLSPGVLKTLKVKNLLRIIHQKLH